MRFQNKVALVTASASGIGKATAEILAREGAHLVAADLNPDSLSDLSKSIKAEGGIITTNEVNVLEEEPVKNLVDSVIANLGKIDILVNAVGGSTIIQNSSASVDNLAFDDWNKVLDFNLRGTFLCTHEVIKHMKRQGNGKIVNISSDAAHSLGEPSSAYVAAKAGIMAFTKKVAKESGPYGVTCNAIAPGMTLSERIQPRWEGRSEEQRQIIIDQIPLGRLSKPEDQAKVIAFLASEDANYVTGVTIDTSGGKH
ncbi:MAG: SDR family oxidoreductase [SAR202 cluster bacterium]|jgi:NAD(P)-dependent dehydrogenase (short-subunit alcohol dehydrogenase family)|nr:MAG: SDR family oxidoreductase [SAR202 cluster bacterium]MCH2318804.1 SDR family oxidoreductase [SAR202 cluster bacterium]MQG74961.1 SDR family oxidoreductase [SAR202 cluster bacterium]|tara:strand:+ start:899 stop:1663 length:765 start_codon:yes stop_codon:yes gene_type:complete